MEVGFDLSSMELVQAISSKDLEKLKKALKTYKANKKIDGAIYPLELVAAEWDCYEAIELLVTNGAAVDSAQYENGPTPLFSAITKFNVENVRALIALGANIKNELVIKAVERLKKDPKEHSKKQKIIDLLEEQNTSKLEGAILKESNVTAPSLLLPSFERLSVSSNADSVRAVENKAADLLLVKDKDTSKEEALSVNQGTLKIGGSSSLKLDGSSMFSGGLKIGK